MVMPNEVIHEVKKSGTEGLVLKLDCEKAYDRVSWEFLFEILCSRGLCTKWINSIRKTIIVRINDTNGPYFVGGKASNRAIHQPPCFLT